MRYYITSAKTVTIGKENNEGYELQINLFANADKLLKDSIITEEYYLNFINFVREFVETDKVIAIGKTKVENEFNVYKFELVSDGKTIYNIRFDEELKKNYIEIGDAVNANN